MSSQYPKFQEILEALQRAQTMGALSILNDKTTRETDDQDCYPRGLRLNLQRNDMRWRTLRFLAKHLDWIELGPGKSLVIRPPQPISFRLTQDTFNHSVAESLRESGIDCVADVYYR